MFIGVPNLQVQLSIDVRFISLQASSTWPPSALHPSSAYCALHWFCMLKCVVDAPFATQRSHWRAPRYLLLAFALLTIWLSGVQCYLGSFMCVLMVCVYLCGNVTQQQAEIPVILHAAEHACSIGCCKCTMQPNAVQDVLYQSQSVIWPVVVMVAVLLVSGLVCLTLWA